MRATNGLKKKKKLTMEPAEICFKSLNFILWFPCHKGDRLEMF